jgi:hypothetical protein
MDLLAYFERFNTHYMPASAMGRGNVFVWDLRAEERPVIASWEGVLVDDICVSSATMRIGIASVTTDGKISFYEIPNKMRLYEIQTTLFIGYQATDVGLVSSETCDKVVVLAERKSVGFDVITGQYLYEFADARNILFSVDGLYVYAKYDFKLAQCDATTGLELRIFELKQAHYEVRQNPSGTRIVWLQDIDEDRRKIELVVVDTVSGEIIQVFPSQLRSLEKFVDDDVVVVVDGESVVDSGGFMRYFNISTGEMTPRAPRKLDTYGVHVVSGVITSFDILSTSIRAYDLATGSELFHVAIPSLCSTGQLSAQSIDVSLNKNVVLM